MGSAVVDRQLVIRILTNLCDNAIKYSTPDSEVTVRVADGSIEVRNAGDGLDPGVHAAAFARGENAAPGSGAGLGLDIVHRLAALLGAAVDCETAVGPVTIVRVRFEGASDD